ncbi:MAG: hypothetical protein R3C18_25825 [Planctomycetaceae bacterium]
MLIVLRATTFSGDDAMAGMDWSELSAEERLVAEQAVMNLRLLNKAYREAKSGTVLSVAEALAMQQGRGLTRRKSSERNRETSSSRLMEPASTRPVAGGK